MAFILKKFYNQQIWNLKIIYFLFKGELENKNIVIRHLFIWLFTKIIFILSTYLKRLILKGWDP